MVDETPRGAYVRVTPEKMTKLMGLDKTGAQVIRFSLSLPDGTLRCLVTGAGMPEMPQGTLPKDFDYDELLGNRVEPKARALRFDRASLSEQSDIKPPRPPESLDVV